MISWIGVTGSRRRLSYENVGIARSWSIQSGPPLPHRRVEGDQAYFDCLEQSIYRPFYHYLTDYLKGSINFEALDVRLLDDLKEYGAADILTGDGHMLSISREIMSQVSEKVQYFLGFAGMDGDKAHYIMKEIRPNEEGKPHVILYTLFSVLDV